jgi:hypothetical protein
MTPATIKHTVAHTCNCRSLRSFCLASTNLLSNSFCRQNIGVFECATHADLHQSQLLVCLFATFLFVNHSFLQNHILSFYLRVVFERVQTLLRVRHSIIPWRMHLKLISTFVNHSNSLLAQQTFNKSSSGALSRSPRGVCGFEIECREVQIF